MQGKARILIYGFSEEEAARIDEALASVGVPRPTRLRPTQGHVALSEIIEHDREESQPFSCSETLVLFFNVSEGGIRALIPRIRSLEVRRPIFATVTETSYRWTLAQLLEHLVEERKSVEDRAAREGAQPESEGS